MPERHLGRTLGRYRVDEVVGSGGFAWVYKGYDPEVGGTIVKLDSFDYPRYRTFTGSIQIEF